MHHNLPSSDPKLLDRGLDLIAGMTITAISTRQRANLSKQNREFFREREEALTEVIRFVQFHRQDRGVSC